MSFGLKIQSVSDIITNSSSELFCIKCDIFSQEEIKEILQIEGEKNIQHCLINPDVVYHKSWAQLEKDNEDSWSGDGGYISVYNLIEWEQDGGYTKDELINLYQLNTNELATYYWIHIDHDRRATIKYIKNNFNIIEANEY